MKTQLLKPGTFKKIKKSIYFRLETGEIAKDTLENVVQITSIKDEVKLIAVKNQSNEHYLWKINNQFTSLEQKSKVGLPNNVEFVDFYEDTTSTFIKYKVGNNFGILKETNRELTIVLSHKRGYKDIIYSNKGFVVDIGDEKTYILDIKGNIIKQFPFKGSKVAGYDIFYNDNQIFTENFSVEELDCKIEDVKVINLYYATLVKVTTNKGIKYYNQKLLYLLGPIKNEEFEHDFQDRCYVYEKEDGKIKSVYFISRNTCTSISSKEEIKIEVVNNGNEDKKFFAVNNNGKKSLFSSDLTCVLENIDAYSIFSTEKNPYYSGNYTIVGYVDREPIRVAFLKESETNLTSYNLETLFKGYKEADDTEQYICKSGNRIICISKTKGVLFNVIGETCKVKFWGTDVPEDSKFRRMVYLIEKGESIVVIDTDGRIIK